VAITSQELIKANASVIAGLIILLTIDSITTIERFEDFSLIIKKYDELALEGDKLVAATDMSAQFVEENADAIIASGAADGIVLSDHDRLVKQTELSLEQKALEKRIDDKLSDTGSIIREIILVKGIIIAIIVPFAFSAIVEVRHISSREDKEDTEIPASKKGRILMVIGFVCVMIGLGTWAILGMIIPQMEVLDRLNELRAILP
jgi:hypothetical protein